MKNVNKRIIKIGSYSIGLTALAVAVIVVLNLFIGQLPSSIIKADLTGDALLTFGDETKKLVAGLDNDVTLYHIVTDGYEDPYVVELLNRYDEESEKVKVEKIDPVKKPTFASQYTEEQITDNTVIVVSENRSKVVSGEEFFMYEPSGYEGTFISYTEYVYYAQMYAQSGASFTATEYFFGEKEISGAIDYVMSETLPVVYQLAGHGETVFGTAFNELTETENVEMKSLTLIAGDKAEVPADAKAVFINVPQSDIKDEEYEALVAYLDNGGYVILTTSVEYYSSEKTPNLVKLAKYMGLSSTSDIVMDYSADHYYQYPYYLIPNTQSAGVMANVAQANYSVIAMLATSINTLEVENRTVNALLKTSDQSFIYDKNITDVESVEKTTFAVGYQSQIVDGESGESAGTFVWFTSPTFFSDQVVSFGNSLVYTDILGITCGKTASINVAAKAITSATLDISATSSLVGYTSYIIIIPLVFLVTGFVIWIRRRRK